jgi:hypothetical protein
MFRLTDTMDIVNTGKKGKHINTLEKYHIYRISKDNLHTNDTDVYNPSSPLPVHGYPSIESPPIRLP